jgi:hypothetical protein
MFKVVYEEGLEEKSVISISCPHHFLVETKDVRTGRIQKHDFHARDEIIAQLKPGDKIYMNFFGETRTSYGDTEVHAFD